MSQENLIDRDGYILLNKEFKKKGFVHILIKELPGDWKIFKRYKEENPKAFHFELIFSKRMPEYIIANVVFPKKWHYPSDSEWGTNAFTFLTEEDCIKKYDKIKSEKKVQKTKDN